MGLNSIYETLYIKSEKTSTSFYVYVGISRNVLMEYPRGRGTEYGYNLRKAHVYISGAGYQSGRTLKEAFKKAYGEARREFKADAMSKLMI